MSLQTPSLAREFEAALAWWHMAGVDHGFTDDATAWLADGPLVAGDGPAGPAGPNAKQSAAPARSSGKAGAAFAGVPASSPEPQATPRRDLLGDSPPADLAAFRRWWMETPDLGPARGAARIPPRGEAGAALMVLVPQPEEGDSDTLLSGPQGRLLANILAAMGLDESAVYIASALPSHTPMADLEGIAQDGMAAVTAYHVGLVAPARLLAFGNGLAAMLGGRLDAPLQEINHGGRKIPVMASETLDALMNLPRLKARFWRRWMEWSATQ